jgi:hypothetical protein
MVFNNGQNTAFFENGPQMNLPVNVRTRLQQEGLQVIEDFYDFHEDELTQAFKNMRTPIAGVPGIPGLAQIMAPDGLAIAVPAVPAVLPIPGSPGVIVSALCAKRLKVASIEVASIAFHYYTSIGRTPVPSNMNYTTVLRDFYIEWEAVLTLNKEDKASVPVLSKQVPPLKWIESFKNHLYNTFGIRKCPLLYVVREDAVVATEVDDPLQPGKSYGESGSVVDELIKRMSHTNPLFNNDNAMVFALLDQATRGTIYAMTIKPYARKKDGRTAFMTLISSHAGKDKWEQTQLERTKFLTNTKWNGKSYSLEVFTGYHRSAYIQLQEAADHVNFQLPTEHSRVGYLINNIENPDPDLRAAIAQIRINTNGMRDNFDLAVESLLPVDPYVKNDKGKKKGAQISALKGQQDSKTGVDLRWHTKDEYKTLTKAQRIELSEWQKSKAGKDSVNKQKSASGYKGRPSAKAKLKAKIKALEAQVKDQPGTPPIEQEPTVSVAEIERVLAAVSSLKQDSGTQKSPIALASAKALQSILKRKREDTA